MLGGVTDPDLVLIRTAQALAGGAEKTVQRIHPNARPVRMLQISKCRGDHTLMQSRMFARGTGTTRHRRL
jgi:hypothetical protein